MESEVLGMGSDLEVMKCSELEGNLRALFVLHPSISHPTDNGPNASTGKSIRFDVVLEDSLWRLLSKDVLDLILKRLPFAAQCRFRCVCRRWKDRLPLLASPCAIMSNFEGNIARFFCHSEEKWFSLPFKKDFSFELTDFTWKVRIIWGETFRFSYCLEEKWYTPSFKENLSLGLNESSWEVIGVDAGLVCYLLFENKVSFWLLVSNPVTTFARLIPPAFPAQHWGQMPCGRPLVKMHVDQKKKSFTVMVVIRAVTETALYHSDKNRWDICTSSPYDFGCHFESLEFFVWRDVFYMYRVLACAADLVLAFKRKIGWKRVYPKFPRDNGVLTNRFIFSIKSDIILIQVCPTASPSFSVWKLLPTNSSNLPDFSLSRWEKVFIESDRAIDKLMKACPFNWASYGTDQLFLFRTEGFKCVKYTFTSETWRVIPGAPGETKVARLYPREHPWEQGIPGVNVESKFARMYPWEPSLEVGGTENMDWKVNSGNRKTLRDGHLSISRR